MVVNDGNDRPAAMVPDDPAAIIRILGLEPLPDEGGMFRQMYKDGSGTAIYFMVADGDFSALHLLDAPEIYLWYGGAPLDLLLLGPDGDAERVLVGPNLLEGQRPQVVVPAGVWQGSSSTGRWSLVGTTMAPAFSWEGFQLGDATELCAAYPRVASRVRELVR